MYIYLYSKLAYCASVLILYLYEVYELALIMF